MQPVIEQLSRVPLAGLMLVVTFGYLLGRIGWRGIAPGPAAGTVVVALLLGWHGFGLEQLYGDTPPALTVGAFGFALFIYAVGFEAGPRLVASMRGRNGWRFVLLGALVVAASLGVAVAAGRVLGLDASSTAGLLAGGVTSASAFAAASESAADPARLSVAFALTYPFGLLGIVLLVQILPRLFRMDWRQDNEVERGSTRMIPRGPSLTRAFRVSRDAVVGVPLSELGLTRSTGGYIARVHRGDEVLVAAAGTMLQLGDHVLVRGRLDELQKFEQQVGPEVFDAELRDRLPAAQRVVVTSRRAAGRALKDLDLMGRHHCMVSRIERGPQPIEPTAEVCLLRGDVVEIVGNRDRVREVARELGRFEPSTHATDIAIYAGGILVGLLIGQLNLSLPGMHFRLGSAGGLLLAGVLLATVRTIGPFSANVPASARQLVSDLGILLFVAETGLGAGRALQAGLDFDWWPVTAAGAAVTTLPVLASLVFGRWVLKLRPVDIWGAISGGMTSSSALVAAKHASDSSEPAIAYAAAFGVGSVFITVAGQLIVALMQ